jgi:nitric oxide reductase large subunit
LQLGDVVANGYRHARTEWFRNHPWLSWARMPGDVVFMLVFDTIMLHLLAVQ